MNEFFPEGFGVCGEERCRFTINDLTDAKLEEKVLEGTVKMCDASHNLIIDLGCMTGVIPREEGA